MTGSGRSDNDDLGHVGNDIRVLIIDDSSSMRKIVRQLLRHKGIKQVEEAGDGKRALAMLRDKGMPDPEVIICDVHMDGMDGVEFCNAVRRDSEIRNRNIPIIMLTGDTNQLVHDVSRQVGAVAVLTKPVSEDDLYLHVQRAVGFVD